MAHPSDYNYNKKTLYIDDKDPNQAECLALLKLAGHKQSKLLGLMAHEFIANHGIDVTKFNNKSFGELYKFLELQVNYNLKMAPQVMATPVYAPLYQEDSNTTPFQKKHPQKKTKNIEPLEAVMSEEDVDEMNDALA
ncbi:MAG: hypothetical protein HUJ70_12835, partial [Pseudobutyrivibrio sp.]|nr:hypothetical protein [Pseudobutyrivibrio sp.]